MTSNPREAFVWIWLPGQTTPVVAGRIEAGDEEDRQPLLFTYGRSYLARRDAIPLYGPELPLRRGSMAPAPRLHLANALRDAMPDTWGRRVIDYRLVDDDDKVFGEFSYMLRSGSNRIGALDFQASPNEYVARESPHASLEDLLTAAERVDQGQSLPRDLAEALLHGTSIGGARPKAMLHEAHTQHIAKFSSSSDQYNVIKAEFIAMRLAQRAGLAVAPVRLVQVMGKDVLLVERFDRELTEDGWTRRAMVSAFTLFGLDSLQVTTAARQRCLSGHADPRSRAA